jgi:hypothetical protein
MWKQQRLEVVDLVRAKTGLAGIQDTEASNGLLLRGRRGWAGKETQNFSRSFDAVKTEVS